MDSEAKANRRLICAALILGSAAPPIWLLAAMLKWAVDFPYWDDWAYLYGTITYLDPGFDWSYVFARQGNHVNASTKLIFYGAYKLAGANLKFCIFLNYVFAWMVCGGMLLLLRRTLPRDGAAWVFYPLAVFFSFSLAQWPVFFSAWGSCWLLLPVFLRAGMLLTDTRLGVFGLGVCLALFSTAASMTLAAGFALWAAFPFYLWLCGRLPQRPLDASGWGALAVWLGGAGLCFVVLSFGPSNDSTTNFLARDEEPQILMLTWCLENPHRAVGFLLSLLGASSSRITAMAPGLDHDHAAVAMAIGNGGISMLLLLLTLHYAFKVKRDAELLKQLAPWLGIAIVELVMAGLVTAGRAGGFTMYRALSSHYGMIGLQFQFATYVGFYLVWRDLRANGRQLRFPMLPKALSIGALVMVAAQLIGQVQLIRDVRENAQQKQFARDAMYFLRALPTSSWPAPLRMVRMHRLDEYDQRNILDLAETEEINRAIANASDRTSETDSKFRISYLPNLHISGQFDALIEGECVTLLVELRGPNGDRVLLPARANRASSEHFVCEESLAIYDYGDHRIAAVYVFERFAKELIRVL